MLHEQGQVFEPVPQWGQAQGDDIQAVEQVFPESSVLHLLLQIPVGGRHDAHVHGDGGGAADAADLPFLEHAQELGLHLRGQLAHVVEEQGAAIGLLEPALVAAAGVGEGARLVAEEFVLHQARGQGGAVQGDEWTLPAPAEVVQGAHHQLLAGAALSLPPGPWPPLRATRATWAHTARRGPLMPTTLSRA